MDIVKEEPCLLKLKAVGDRIGVPESSDTDRAIRRATYEILDTVLCCSGTREWGVAILRGGARDEIPIPGRDIFVLPTIKVGVQCPVTQMKSKWIFGI